MIAVALGQKETLLDISVAEDVIYIPLDDFQTDLPQADMIADFVLKAMKKEHNIICQCEKGQNRSAGCAAAIMEYYYKDGQSLFDDDWYSPDEMVYYKLLDALENDHTQKTKTLYNKNNR